MARLKRLEGVVQTLGKNVDDEDDVGEPEPKTASPKVVEQEQGTRNEKEKVDENGCGLRHNGTGIFGLHSVKDDSDRVTTEFGRLKVDGGRSRYVSNKFWVSLSEEVRLTKKPTTAISDSFLMAFISPEGVFMFLLGASPSLFFLPA